MKKLFLLLTLLCALATAGLAQQAVPWTIEEIDGAPRVPNPKIIKVTNGSLSCVDKVCTLTVGGGAGTVTSVSWTGGIVSIANPTTTPAFTIAGTSGGIPYFNSATTWASSAALAANALVIGGGAGAAPSTTTTGTGVVTALGVNVGSAGAFVTFNGAGGTPSSLTLTNATGLPPTTGISGWPANAVGILTNDGAGVLTWGAGASGANPTASVGLAAVNGVATTYLRSDGAPALDQGIVPTWTGIHTFTNGVTTGTGATSGTVFNYNSLTTGVGANFSSSSATSGSIVNIASTSTAGATGVEGLNIAMSGANGTSAQTVTGATISVTNTNATSGTNVGLAIAASGATTANHAISVSAGQSLFPLGTALLPSLTFQTDPNTGFFAFGSDQFAWTIGGTVNGVFNSVGARVGRGNQFGWSNSADASASFHVAGFTSHANATVRVTDGSTGAGSFLVGATSTLGSVGTSGVGVLVIANGTVPSTFPADQITVLAADTVAGASECWIYNEAGERTQCSGLGSRNSSSFAKTTDTTLANITGLTRNVAASRTYAFRAVVQTTAAVTGGVKFAISGTATATAISYEGRLEGGAALIAQTRATALDTTVCASTTATAATCFIDGVIQVNAAGTLTVQFAQNASDAGASTVLANSLFYLVPIN